MCSIGRVKVESLNRHPSGNFEQAVTDMSLDDTEDAHTKHVRFGVFSLQNDI